MRVPLTRPECDYERFRRSVLREGPADRIAAGEQHADLEIMSAVLGVPAADWSPRHHVEVQWRMGYDYVNVLVVPPDNILGDGHVRYTGEGQPGEARRGFVNEQSGPVGTWEEFERFRFPTVEETDLSRFAAYRPHLPPGMRMNAFLSCAYFSKVTWTVGLQPFCYLLMDDRPLVKAIFEKWAAWAVGVTQRCLAVPDIGAFWMSDDLGFNTGPFLSPDDLREFVYPVFAEIGRRCRARGLPLILHSCGNLNAILGDLADCGVHSFHSLPPGLYDLRRLKQTWGHRLAFQGNIDLNLLGRGTEPQVREAVRAVKAVWAEAPAGGILLSTSNSVAHYCRLENYLAMMDEMLA